VREHLKRKETDPGRDLFFSYTTNCLETLGLLRERGVFSVVDQVDPGRVEEDIVLEEAERWPGWVKVPGRLPQSYWDRLKAEWKLADAVLVNSRWSADALVNQGVPPKKIMVVPLAINLPADRPTEPVVAQGSLTVLWLGSVVLRKGIQYLVEAARRLQNEVQFLVAGPVYIDDSVVAGFPPNIQMMGRVTRDLLGEMYRRAHVFVLPTLSDGFAVTQLEAMSYGLPVIATPNCGRVVEDGVNGLIVPARDSAALAEAISRLGRDSGLLREMSSQALKTVVNYEVTSVAGKIQRDTLELRDNLRKS
jgi:glycosyltransferase involved in cell wall biosynthesis